MPVSTQAVGDRLLLSPREPLLAGGAAEAFELQLRQLVRTGHKNLVVDLGGVPYQTVIAPVRAVGSEYVAAPPTEA